MLREAAGVPHDRPEGPYSQRPEHLLTYTEGLEGFAIPPTLAPGEYIVRHEILALHLASLPMGAQFYPYCIQIRVTSGGTSELPKGVAIPGAYDPEDEESVSLPLIFGRGSNIRASGESC